MDPVFTHLLAESRTTMLLRVRPRFLVNPQLLTLG
jgi:hypothetical protein